MSQKLLCGIDIGSRSGKAVIINESGQILFSRVLETIGSTHKTYSALQNTIPDHLKNNIISTAATGYGRVSLEEKVSFTSTEITCHYLGVSHLFPKTKTIVDIGGQDSKIITIDDKTIKDFLMNDRCAAGTGRFIEVMITRLGYTLKSFSQLDVTNLKTVPINSTCTVFAESEIISLMATDTDIDTLAASIAYMAANNVQFMMKRMHAETPIYMSGGVARIKPVIQQLQKITGVQIITDEHSQIMGALGAALRARQKMRG